MPEITLSTFKSNVKDVARPNRFYVIMDSPAPGMDEKISYYIKSASLPGKNLGEIQLNWQGMNTKIAGDITFDDWSVTVLSDPEMKVRQAFLDWQMLVADHLSNIREEPVNYKKDLLVQKLDRQGNVVQTFKLVGAWVKTMDQVELSTDTNDAAMEFTVTFSYDYWEIVQ